jgi:hypothetical protein
LSTRTLHIVLRSFQATRPMGFELRSMPFDVRGDLEADFERCRRQS